jgi:transketolase
MKDYNIAMRDAFFEELYDIATQDRRVVLLSDDFGAPSLDRFKKDLSHQYVFSGIAEQNMVSLAAGLALGGKIVIIYAIAPFTSLRCYEQIKLDLCCMNLPVTALGVGAGYAYSTAGPTHHATEDIAIMRALPGMTVLNPSDSVMAAAFAGIACRNPGPKYIRLDRDKLPPLYKPRDNNFSEGLSSLKAGSDLTIIATGIMVHQSFSLAEELAKHSIDAGIIDLYRIKPVNTELLLKLTGESKRVVTLEENLIDGGIGSIIAEILMDNGRAMALKRIGTRDQYCFKYGSRDYLHTFLGLDVKSVTSTILKFLS